jgi:hypothetical protein
MESNRVFVGRKDLLNRLEDFVSDLYNDFHSPNASLPTRVWYLSGIGGSGKTWFLEQIGTHIETLHGQVKGNEDAHIRPGLRGWRDEFVKLPPLVAPRIIDFLHPDNRDYLTVAAKMLESLLPLDLPRDSDNLDEQGRSDNLDEQGRKKLFEEVLYPENKVLNAEDEELYKNIEVLFTLIANARDEYSYITNNSSIETNIILRNFIEHWNNISTKRPIIIRFDTIERISMFGETTSSMREHKSFLQSEPVKEITLEGVKRFFQHVIPKLKSTLLVMSGRPSYKEDNPENSTLKWLTTTAPKGIRFETSDIAGFSNDDIIHLIKAWRRSPQENNTDPYHVLTDLLPPETCKRIEKEFKKNIYTYVKDEITSNTTLSETNDIWNYITKLIRDEVEESGDKREGETSLFLTPLLIQLYLDDFRVFGSFYHTRKKGTTSFRDDIGDRILDALSHLPDKDAGAKKENLNHDAMRMLLRICLADGRGGLTAEMLRDICKSYLKSNIDCDYVKQLLADDPVVRRVSFWYARFWYTRSPYYQRAFEDEDLYYLHDEMWVMFDHSNAIQKNVERDLILHIRSMLREKTIEMLKQKRQKNKTGQMQRLMADHIIYTIIFGRSNQSLEHLYFFVDELLRLGYATGALALVDTFWRQLRSFKREAGREGDRENTTYLDVLKKRISPENETTSNTILTHYDNLLYLRFLEKYNQEMWLKEIDNLFPSRDADENNKRKNYPHVALEAMIGKLSSLRDDKKLDGISEWGKGFDDLLNLLEKHKDDPGTTEFERELFDKRKDYLRGSIYFIIGQSYRSKADTATTSNDRELAKKYLVLALEFFKQYLDSQTNKDDIAYNEDVVVKAYEALQSLAYLRANTFYIDHAEIIYGDAKQTTATNAEEETLREANNDARELEKQLDNLSKGELASLAYLVRARSILIRIQVMLVRFGEDFRDSAAIEVESKRLENLLGEEPEYISNTPQSYLHWKEAKARIAWFKARAFEEIHDDPSASEAYKNASSVYEEAFNALIGKTPGLVGLHGLVLELLRYRSRVNYHYAQYLEQEDPGSEIEDRLVDALSSAVLAEACLDVLNKYAGQDHNRIDREEWLRIAIVKRAQDKGITLSSDNTARSSFSGLVNSKTNDIEIFATKTGFAGDQQVIKARAEEIIAALLKPFDPSPPESQADDLKQDDE